MAEQKLVRVEVTRAYPRDGVTHPVGKEIVVPENVLTSMEAANPPYGKRIGPAKAVKAEAEAAPAPAPATDSTPEPEREYRTTDGSVTEPDAAPSKTTKTTKK